MIEKKTLNQQQKGEQACGHKPINDHRRIITKKPVNIHEYGRRYNLEMDELYILDTRTDTMCLLRYNATVRTLIYQNIGIDKKRIITLINRGSKTPNYMTIMIRKMCILAGVICSACASTQFFSSYVLFDSIVVFFSVVPDRCFI